MPWALDLAAALLALVAIAHTVLGERYILQPLFRRDNLPRLFGGTEFTTRTLRFAWHLTSLAWLGLAIILVLIAHPPVNPGAIGQVVGVILLIHGLVALGASRGRHLAWIPFLSAGILAIWGSMG